MRTSRVKVIEERFPRYVVAVVLNKVCVWVMLPQHFQAILRQSLFFQCTMLLVSRPILSYNCNYNLHYSPVCVWNAHASCIMDYLHAALWWKAMRESTQVCVFYWHCVQNTRLRCISIELSFRLHDAENCDAEDASLPFVTLPNMFAMSLRTVKMDKHRSTCMTGYNMCV